MSLNHRLGASFRAPIAVGMVNASTAVQFTLNAQYTYNSAGRAYAARFLSPYAGELKKVHVWDDAHTGSPGDHTIEIRDFSSGAANKPNNLLTNGSGTLALDAATAKWRTLTFGTGPTLSVGECYFGAIGNPNANAATDYMQVVSAAPPQQPDGGTSEPRGFTTTNGFTAQTVVAQPGAMVFEMASGDVFGCPWVLSTTHASSTTKRGYRVEGGFDADHELFRISIGAASNVSKLQVFFDGKGPNDTPDFDITINGSITSLLSALFAATAIARGTGFRAVLTFSGNSTAPGYFSMGEASPPAGVLACGLGGGKIYHTKNGDSNTWTDEKHLAPRIALQAQSITGAAGGAMHPLAATLVGGRA